MAINWNNIGAGAISGAGMGSSFGPWGTAIGGVAGGIAGLFGGGDDEGGGGLNLPSFYEDPYYDEAQSYLMPYSKNLLEGNIPDYYKAIGEHGGQEFEGLMGMINRDVKTGVNEDLIRRNVGRGGIGSTAIAKTMADVGTKLRFEDYSRALKGKEFLMNTGSNMMGGVRDAGLTNQAQRNAFNLKSYGMAEDTMDKEDDLWQTIMSSGVGAIGTGLAGYYDRQPQKTYGSADFDLDTSDIYSGNLDFSRF